MSNLLDSWNFQSSWEGTIYINLLNCKGSEGVFNGHEKPRGVEELLPRSLLGLAARVVGDTGGRLAVCPGSRQDAGAEGWDGLEL